MELFVSKNCEQGVTYQRGDSALTSQAAPEEDATEIKLAVLASLHPHIEETDVLLEALLAADGSVDVASTNLNYRTSSRPLKRPAGRDVIGHQSSLAFFATDSDVKRSPRKIAPKRGQTLRLYSAVDIAASTPCSIIHNFLPTEEADALLRELLAEAPSFGRETFRIFDNVVTSPHSMCFYVNDYDEAEQQKTQYLYNGSCINDVRQTLPVMRRVAVVVQDAVNREIAERIETQYPGKKKLKYQSNDTWKPNTAFVNCYDGCKESVGYHSDQLTYLGPRAVIGSLSLGVAREFRVRRVVPRSTVYEPGDVAAKKADEKRADMEGQISIHLPHNSLLVMHAEMQEEYKHAIAPALAIDPHPIAGNKRLNITYRCYRESFHPKHTPRCRCNVPTVLRCVQKQQETRGRYMWMCHAGYTPGEKGCSFFQWAEFDDNGEPPWATQVRAGGKDVQDAQSRDIAADG